MKKSRLLGAICTFLFTFITMSAHAALISVLGGQAVYDEDRDITWVANANLALTNQFGLTLSTIESDGTANTVGSTGKMTWDNAIAWVAGMNVSDGGNGYLGFNDWRLPDTLQPDSSCDFQNDLGSEFPIQGSTFNCTGSEMGHLYNEEGVTSTTPNLFSNVQSNGYWSSTEYAPNPTSIAWLLNFDDGNQTTFIKSGISIYALAVRSGNVATVPVPAAVWFFGSGLVGLIGISRRKKAG